MASRISQITRNILKNIGFSGSKDYWSQRYAEGGDSGAGSYGRFARFKADVINRLVRERGVESMVELGCGDGNQASLFEVPRYVGLDVAPGAVERAHAVLKDKPGFECRLYEPSEFDPATSGLKSDAALSLDVLYHLVEDDVYQLYLRQLFGLAERYVVIYSSNKRMPAFVTNRHVRHRRFTDDIPQGWELDQHIPNPYPSNFMGIGGSFADFYIFSRCGQVAPVSGDR